MNLNLQLFEIFKMVMKSVKKKKKLCFKFVLDKSTKKFLIQTDQGTKEIKLTKAIHMML